jgi:hypothetical protein
VGGGLGDERARRRQQRQIGRRRAGERGQQGQRGSGGVARVQVTAPGGRGLVGRWGGGRVYSQNGLGGWLKKDAYRFSFFGWK